MVKGGRFSEYSGRPMFYFFNWISAMTRHHDAKPNTDILFTRNLPFDSDIKQWRHHLMIPLSAYNTTRGQFECDVTSFWFCFEFVHMHGRLLFHNLCTFASCTNKTGRLQNELLKMWIIINKCILLCPTEQKKKLFRLAILKVIRKKHQSRASCHLYCTACELVLLSHFKDHMLFSPVIFEWLHWK